MTDPSSRYVVGVDVGGTFTDVFFLNEASAVHGAEALLVCLCTSSLGHARVLAPLLLLAADAPPDPCV